MFNDLSGKAMISSLFEVIAYIFKEHTSRNPVPRSHRYVRLESLPSSLGMEPVKRLSRRHLRDNAKNDEHHSQ